MEMLKGKLKTSDMTKIKYFKEFNNIPNEKRSKAKQIFNEVVRRIEYYLDTNYDSNKTDAVDRILLPFNYSENGEVMFDEPPMKVYPKNSSNDSVSKIHSDIIFKLRETKNYPTIL